MAFRRLISNIPKTNFTTTYSTTTNNLFCRHMTTNKTAVTDLSNAVYNGLISKGNNAGPIIIFFTKDRYVIKLDMPGIRNSDLRCNVVGSNITISAQEPKPHRFGLGRLEARYYEAELEVDTLYYKADEVKADMKNGVLWVELPKVRVGLGPETLGCLTFNYGPVKFTVDKYGKTNIVVTG